MKIGEENGIIEFKKTTGELKDSMDDISALLNKYCKDTIYFGVMDDGSVKGQQISDSTKKDVSRIIS
ncbi:MAG: putative DNA binding domain-containing protein [Bacilli bacterium]|nr:putative DNA binding domain-containing protein [Bacilli bacterium]